MTPSPPVPPVRFQAASKYGGDLEAERVAEGVQIFIDGGEDSSGYTILAPADLIRLRDWLGPPVRDREEAITFVMRNAPFRVILSREWAEQIVDALLGQPDQGPICKDTGSRAVNGACPVHRGDACLVLGQPDPEVEALRATAEHRFNTIQSLQCALEKAKERAERAEERLRAFEEVFEKARDERYSSEWVGNALRAILPQEAE